VITALLVVLYHFNHSWLHQ